MYILWTFLSRNSIAEQERNSSRLSQEGHFYNGRSRNESFSRNGSFSNGRSRDGSFNNGKSKDGSYYNGRSSREGSYSQGRSAEGFSSKQGSIERSFLDPIDDKDLRIGVEEASIPTFR